MHVQKLILASVFICVALSANAGALNSTNSIQPINIVPTNAPPPSPPTKPGTDPMQLPIPKGYSNCNIILSDGSIELNDDGTPAVSPDCPY